VQHWHLRRCVLFDGCEFKLSLHFMG
jgi:hypothetical protein